MTVMDDTIRGLTLADPDGPLRFIETLGLEVPTYINPRTDLLAPTTSDLQKTFKRLDYHVPFRLRGEFKPEDWPEAFRKKMGKSVRVGADGYVMCHAPSARANGPCGNKAVNRSVFCRNHGACLHPADKKVSSKTLAPIPEDRIENMDRVQKFLQGFIKPEDLQDDEVQGGFIRNNQGLPVRARTLGLKFEATVAKELHARLNRFLQSNTADMLQVMVDIAKNDLYEAADRVKAAIWVSERTLGKTPDVVIQGTTSAPYQSIIEGIESGSREDYRKSVQSFREPVKEVVEITDAEEVDLSEPDYSEVTTVEDSGLPEAGDEVLSADVSFGAGSGSGDGDEAGTDQSVQERAEQIQDNRTARLEHLKKQRKAKMRRIAARAVGATSLSDVPWLAEFKAVRGTTQYRVKWYPPDNQTPAVVQRILEERSWEEPSLDGLNRRRAQAADEEVDAIRRKMEKLASNVEG